MRVLLILNHAPDYREPFLRELADKVDLTVLAQPCEPDGLETPKVRGNYDYISIPSRNIMGFRLQSNISNFINISAFDIICCNLNPRQPHWILLFLRNKRYWKKWVWWGGIFGKNQTKFLTFIKSYLLSRSAGCLVYSEPIERVINDCCSVMTKSFNNTEVKQNEFRKAVFGNHPELRLLFVGRFQKRKRLERLIGLVERNENIYVRLIGSGMNNLEIPEKLLATNRIKIFDKTMDEKFLSHVDWADMFVNPGHAGLLVMNASRYGKGIVIDSGSTHAPEYWLAKEAKQPFIQFEDEKATDDFFTYVINNRHLLKQWGEQLQDIAKEKYTIEYMAEAHYTMFKNVLDKINTS